ncbi:Hsp90 protein-domain-containing protein [Irpex rosettiformis]|uniref:Hsp90 protein-domain-containing protein n=1 Tax=Irpex rosettiformis TaxID=378272 RepID=A0ACB8UDD0_9APHY|nr:Hsp90 protein-domain-containing protein [Irpex rosettiformis]
MRVVSALLLSLTLFTTSLLALAADGAQKQEYQSDVARLRKIVINSLYSHRDVFLRELISNANDALEKLRITSLTDKQVLGGADDLNITIVAHKNEDGTAKLVIRDTGIGMTPEELTKNLGTLAKSGTSEFLAKAEGSTDTSNTGNLIGAFGLGFYSSFLIADKVYVTSLAAKTAKNPNPSQYVFSSSAEDSTFEVYPDERGNTLGRGTEITMVLKNDALEYLDPVTITELVNKHSSFSTTFPIYLFTQRTEEIEVEAEDAETEAEEQEPADELEIDEEEALVEDVEEEKEVEQKKETKTVTVDKWVHLNSQPPIWMRDPKTITDDEYTQFYQATFKDHQKPLAWHHFSGDSGSGTAFRAILFIPSHLDDKYWQNPLQSAAKDIRLMVKRVFITSDLGEDALPKWASWVKVVVDAEDLPLNVSRETLQSRKFLKQLQSIIVKRLLQTLQRLHENKDGELEAWQLHHIYNNVFKLGAVEDMRNREKLASLVKLPTNQRNETTLNDYVADRKEGQKQIFYLADMGKTPEDLAKSVFIEKLHARGYEVLLLGEPLDEVFVQNVGRWKKLPFQDVAKAGLKFGDEELDPKEEKERQNQLNEEFKPLLDFLKKETAGVIRDVVVSNRLVTSPCAIVADAYGYTANMAKLLNSQQKSGANVVHDYAKRLRTLEINPKSPLIEGLLKRVEQLPSEEEEHDLEAEDEIKEVISVLVDSALVRSGFEVPSANDFFQRMDRILRRSLGVSETAPTDTTVKPAPPVAQEVLDDEEYDFDDSHMQIDPEALGLKVGKPVLKDGEEDPFKADWKEFKRENLKAAVEGQEGESTQKPIGHDEL